MGSLSTVQGSMLACGEKEAMVMSLPSMRDSAVSLASVAAQLSSTGIYPNPPWSPPSQPLYLSLCSQQQPSPWA